MFERTLLEGGTSSFEFEPRENLKFHLAQNYPNPFSASSSDKSGSTSGGNSITNINFTLPQSIMVELMIFNSSGEKVRTLIGGHREAGTHTIGFDASDLTTGVYYYRLQSKNYDATKKLILLK